MNNLSTISWTNFFIVAIILVLIWLLSTRTRLGKKIIIRETPWDISQWTRFLLAILITLFILIDPILHVLTIGIFGILYYVFVSKNLLFKNLRNINSGDRINSGLSFISGGKNSIKILCKNIKHKNLLETKSQLDKCLFSFPMLLDGSTPFVQQINDEFEIELSLVSKDYVSSFMDYIKNSGFEVELIK